MNRPYVHPTVIFSQSSPNIVRRRTSPVRFLVRHTREGGKTIKRNFLPPNKPRTGDSAHTLEVGPDLDLEDEADN